MATQTTADNAPVSYNHRCSFCGRERGRVLSLIAGPNETFICNGCVDFSRSLFSEQDIPAMPKQQVASNRSMLRVLAPTALPFAQARFVEECAKRNIAIEVIGDAFRVMPPPSIRTENLTHVLRGISMEIYEEEDGENTQG